MTTPDIAEIERRATAATPGPLERSQPPHDGMTYFYPPGERNAWLALFERSEDATFFDKARTDIPALLSLVRAERERADAAEQRAEIAEGDEDILRDRATAAEQRAATAERDYIMMRDAHNRYRDKAEQRAAQLQTAVGVLAFAARLSVRWIRDVLAKRDKGEDVDGPYIALRDALANPAVQSVMTSEEPR